MGALWNGICDVVNDIIAAIIMLLPTSPFSTYELPQEVQDILGYVNYFVPFSHMVAIGTTWTAAIGIYYLYQTILRWSKAIK